MQKLKILTIIVLIIICIYNSGRVIYRLIEPEFPLIQVYKKRLQDIEFPLIFQICLNEPKTNWYKSIRWKLAIQYPACQNLDLHDYIYFKNKSPSFIVFTFNVQKNLGVCLFPEERNKATSRSLKFDRLTYSGPTIILGKDGKRIFRISTWHATLQLKRVKIKLNGGLAFKPISITL